MNCPSCSSEVIIYPKITFCPKCGYHTTRFYDNKTKEELIEMYNDIPGIPKLVFDLIINQNNTNWKPYVGTVRGIGCITVYGTSLDEWCWLVVKEQIIPVEERYKFPIAGQPGKYFETRLDIENAKQFDWNQFDECLAELKISLEHFLGRLTQPD